MKNQGKYTWLVIAVNSFFAELTIIIADALIFKDELPMAKFKHLFFYFIAD